MYAASIDLGQKMNIMIETTLQKILGQNTFFFNFVCVKLYREQYGNSFNLRKHTLESYQHEHKQQS